MLNKKGFTLIELLVTIVIMISILGLAIVSVNKISESRKKAAYESVKEQVITAAKEYFTNNEYFIKGLATTESELGYVSLGTLVNLDYINAVTNPVNNQKLDECSYVTVNTNGEYDFVDDQEEIEERFSGDECIMEAAKVETKEHVESKVVLDAAFTVNIYRKNINECSSEGVALEPAFSYSKDEGVTMQETQWFNNIEAPNGLYLEIINKSALEYTFVDNKKQLCITEDNIHEIKIKATEEYKDKDNEEYTLKVKLDRIPPAIVAIPNKTTWTNAQKLNNWTNAEKVYIDIKLSDDVSKVKSEERYWNKYGLTKAQADSNNYKWAGSSGYNNGSSSKINNINMKEYNHTVNYSGEGYRKGRIKACDYADNCITQNEDYEMGIDRKMPTMVVTRQKCDYNSSTDKYSNCSSYSNNTWINKWVKTSMTASDEMSGIEKSCYSTSGATTNSQCADTMKYDDTISRVIHAQGKSYIRYATCDKAGNCLNASTGSTLYTVKLDRTPPRIVSFVNTNNTNCKTSTGATCYYSHTVTAADYNPNNISVSGLKSSYNYNHCYDSASSSQTNIICPAGFKSTGSKNNAYIYPNGYAGRAFTNGSQVQHYTHISLSGYYNLFYKIYDNAGNSTCYRYKLNYTNNNKYTTAVPVWVSGAYHCDDK